MEKVLKDRFMFLFEGLDIEVFLREDEIKRKEELDKKIFEIKAEQRRQNKLRKLRELEKELDEEIQSYLLKASPPRNDFEKMLLSKMKKELGTITSVRELSRFLKMNKTCIYKAVDNGEILSFKHGKRKFLITEGVLPFLREQ